MFSPTRWRRRYSPGEKPTCRRKTRVRYVSQVGTHEWLLDQYGLSAPKNARIALALYIWDFHSRKPVPVELMEQQCEFGLKCLKAGRIRDMIFLANTVLDVGLPSAEYSRQWIKKHGNEKLTP